MEDFNLPSLERTALLERLQEAIGNVPPHFWAACQICDLNALENFVNCGREYPSILCGFAQQTYIMAHYWGPSPPRAQSQSSTPTKQTPSKGITPSTPPAKRQKTSESPAEKHRSQRFRDLAEQRDNACCVLTGAASIEVAHIYPFHSMKYQENESGQRHIFWNHLKCFWPKEKITAWEAEIFPAGICEFGIEQVYNLITLSKAAHDMWSRGAFALKPISKSEDKKTMEVQFFWQKKQQETQTFISLTTTPFSTEGLEQNTDVFKNGHRARLFKEDEIVAAIQSGDYFTLQTDDPETKPLPSFTLLELQWFLQRIQGMAGAADFHWPSLSESGSDYSDEEAPDLEPYEAEDLSLLSLEPLPSPTKFMRNSNLNLPTHPKHQETEGDGEGAEQGRQVAM